MLTWDELDGANHSPLAHYQIIRRTGAVVPFEPSKIAIAMMKAFMSVRGKYAFIGGPARLCGHLPSALLPVAETLKRWLWAAASSTKQHLYALFKLVGVTSRLQPGKANGFFSASKANLRNAP